VAITLLLWTGGLSIAILVAIELVIGTAIALSQAANRTLVNDLVPADRLSSAIALDSVVFNVSTLVGPAVAGAVMLAFDLTVCFAVITVLTTVHLVILFLVVPAGRSRTAGEPESMLSAIVTATRYALAHPGIGPMLALHLAFTLCARPLIDMLPAYAGGVLHAGVDAVSLLTSAIGAGAITSGLWLASRRSHLGLCRIVLNGMLWMGLAMVAFAAAPNLLVAAALALVIGAGMTVRAAGIQTLIQLAAADHLRGRVLSFYGLVLNGGVALGAALMGGLAEAMGLRGAIATMALVSLAIWAAVMMRRHEIAAALEPAN
jgi:predicted MFS family arabinose efflux permease